MDGWFLTLRNSDLGKLVIETFVCVIFVSSWVTGLSKSLSTTPQSPSVFYIPPLFSPSALCLSVCLSVCLSLPPLISLFLSFSLEPEVIRRSPLKAWSRSVYSHPHWLRLLTAKNFVITNFDLPVAFNSFFLSIFSPLLNPLSLQF